MLLLVWRSCPGRAAALRELAAMGFENVQCADSAVAAFALLAHARPRLVIVDADLKPTTGLVFVREMRATTVASRDAPAVILDHRRQDALPGQARRAGADGVIFGGLTPAALHFWLSCTGEGVRQVVQGKDYRGPDRREAGRAFDAVEEERRRARLDQSGLLAAAAADPVILLLTHAQTQARAWSETGEEAALAAALAAVAQAAETAKTDPLRTLSDTLSAAHDRMVAEAESWDAEPMAIIAVLSLAHDFAWRRLSARHTQAERAL